MHNNNTVVSNPKKSKTKIALVDDHALFREGMAKVIDDFGNYKVTIKAGNGREFMEQLNSKTLPDIVLLDLNMPVLDGYETSRWLIENYPGIRIVILTMFNSELAIIRLLKLGVRSFIKKDTHPDELKYALHVVKKVGFYNPVVSQPDPSPKKPLRITENEHTFLKWVTTDLTYKEIAKEMCVSSRTIENYWESLKDKLSVKSRIGLAMYAVKSGVADI